MSIIQDNKKKLDSFVNGGIDLAGKYPDIPQEVYDVFYGMFDGKIQKYDIYYEFLYKIANGVYDTWFTAYPYPYNLALRAYCIAYMVYKAEKVHGIIGDTTIFELPSDILPDLESPQFILHKEKLDAIFDDLKDQLKDLWPDDDAKKDNGKGEEKHLKQMSKISELETELLSITTFINNPMGPIEEFGAGLQENYNATLERINNLKKSIGQFWDKLKEAGTRLENLDLPSLSELNDSIFLEMTSELEQNIKTTCEASINTYKEQMKTAEGGEKGRLAGIIAALTKLKQDPKSMKEYIDNAIRKNDIEALNISVNNQKYIEELSKISIEYDQNKSIFNDFGIVALLRATLFYKLYETQLEGKRICDCIRVFNKMKSVDNGLNDFLIRACLDYTKAYFPLMTAAEQSTFANGVAKGSTTNSGMTNKFGLDRLVSAASKITTETKDIIKKTKTSQSTTIKN
jgi:hypothetical protein